MTTTLNSSYHSEPSFIEKFFYKTICTRCAPEHIRINKAINKQIATKLLYTYDPEQIEVGKQLVTMENLIKLLLIQTIRILMREKV
jgi:hypothetical protein